MGEALRARPLHNGWIAAAIGVALWPAGAGAESFAYLTQGRQLVRGDGRVIEVRDLAAPSAWRRVFQLRGEAADVRLDRLTCDPGAPDACFAALAAPGSDRRTWRPLSLVEPPTRHWAEIADLPVEVEDVDARSGEVLAVIKAAAAPRPSDPPPGFYLYRDGQPPQRIGALAPTASAIHYARFLRGEDGAPGVLLLRGGADGAWITLHGDLSPAGELPWTGEPRALDGRDIIFAGDTPAGAGLWRMPLPGSPGAGRPTPLYLPGGADGNPPIAPLTAPYFPGDVVVMKSGRVLALTAGQTGQGVVAFCPRGPAAVSRPYAAELGDAPVLSIAGGGDHAVLARFNAWGQRRAYQLTDSAGPACGAGAPSLEALPTDDRDPGPLPIAHRSAPADDGETIPYAVLAGPGRKPGPLLIRVYGGNDLPALAMASTPFERLWLQRGGRLVVPTLRGDARFPPWRIRGGGDYQARAVKDLFSVIDDMTARGEARPGEIDILGDSLGAFTAARAALTRPELFNAALLVSGALDLELQARQRSTTQGIGPATGGFKAWYGAAPNPRTCATVRFYAYTGGSDALVDQANSGNFTAYATGLGYSAHLQVYPRADHGLLNLPVVAETILLDLGDVARAKALCPKR